MSSTVIINLIIQLVAGAAGGNALGKGLKQFDLGGPGNTIAGAIGGLGGGAWLGPLIAGAGAMGAESGFDIGALAGDIVGGGVGGAVLTLIVGIVRKLFAGKSPA